MSTYKPDGEGQILFGLFLLSMALSTTVYFFLGACQGKIRRQIFNKDFMAQFNELHQEAFGTTLPFGGYPDTGNGIYAEKLSYKDWFTFNNWQRAHLNFWETIAPVFTLLLICAIHQRTLAVVCGFTIFFGRVIYSLGYCAKGPKGRLVGAIMYDLAFVAAFVGSIITLTKW